jgi:hypothetical protein
LDDRAVGDRIAKRNTEFDHIRASLDGRKYDLTRGRKIRIAAGDVRDERRPVWERKRHFFFNRQLAIENRKSLRLPI